jgi:hypothetical protein
VIAKQVVSILGKNNQLYENHNGCKNCVDTYAILSDSGVAETVT